MFNTLTNLAKNVQKNGFRWTTMMLLTDGLPTYQNGDRVVVMDELIRGNLQDDTAQVEEANCQFGRWEYHIFPENPSSSYGGQLSAKYGSWVTEDEIERI